MILNTFYLFIRSWTFETCFIQFLVIVNKLILFPYINKTHFSTTLSGRNSGDEDFEKKLCFENLIYFKFVFWKIRENFNILCLTKSNLLTNLHKKLHNFWSAYHLISNKTFRKFIPNSLEITQLDTIVNSIKCYIRTMVFKDKVQN